MSAHLDAVPGSPGADDDATGLVTGLAVAAALAECPLRHGLRMIAFDEEEEGYLGSEAYAARVQAEELDLAIGMLQVEMTGYDGDCDGAFLVVDCEREDSRFLTDALLSAVETLAVPLHPEFFCIDASDHGPFWAIGVPAIVMGELAFTTEGRADPNPCAHEPCDTVDKLDFDYMADLTRAAALSVARIVVAR